MAERRNHPRVKVSHPVLYFTDSYPRPKVGQTVDLSLGGARIETTHGLISGERLEISIAIRPQVIKCRGQVVHILWPGGEKLKAGIRFEELSKQDRLYLGEYISYLIEQRNKGINRSPSLSQK
jgi:c-di-GMP-binding flagellar brake protein YcgR